jgi:hypothetical protein
MEQLRLILARANPLPLRLRIQWPAAPGTLELLVSRKYPIHTLAFSNRSMEFMISRCFGYLNLARLQELRFEDLSLDEAGMVLNVVWKSNCPKITLDVYRMPDSPLILRHPLSQRAIGMRIRLGQ